jgi:DNA-binding MarR family transcriptional regulator
MLDPMSNVSRLVDKLFNSGLVERKICPSDRRQVELLLTSIGIRTLEEADESLKELGNIFTGISEERLELLNEILDQLRSEKL